jgi:hypothetical protein
MRTIGWIIGHTAAAYDAKRHRVVHQTVETVRQFHMLPVARYDAAGKLVAGTGGRGFKDIGYHRYIEVDGKIRLGRLDSVDGAHVEHFNEHSLGVCCSGHGDYETWNRAQLDSFVAQCSAWCRIYGLAFDRVAGHHENERYGGPPVAKSCPGKLIDMDMIRARLRAELAGASRGIVPVALDEEPPTRPLPPPRRS